MLPLSSSGNCCMDITPWLIDYWIPFFWATYINPTAEAGTGTKFGYGGPGVLIHKNAVIGRNCIISQHSTIGELGL